MDPAASLPCKYPPDTESDLNKCTICHYSKHMVGTLPLIDALVHDFDIVWTVDGLQYLYKETWSTTIHSYDISHQTRFLHENNITRI